MTSIYVMGLVLFAVRILRICNNAFISHQYDSSMYVAMAFTV